MRRFRNSPTAPFTSSPACYCRFGTGCRPRTCASTASRQKTGERVIGRLVTPEALASVYEGLGIETSPGLSPDEAWNAVIHRGAVLDLAGGLQIRRSLVMSMHRVELTGFTDGMVPQLKALGLTSEIIAWRLRLFVPVAADRGPALLSTLLDRHPLLRAKPRAAA